MTNLPLRGTYRQSDDEKEAEYVLPVRWIRTRAREEAFWVKTLRAYRSVACQITHASTIETLTTEFGLQD